MRGYTRFTFEHGDEAAARLAGRFADLAEAVVAAHRGQVIELRGDEALAVFDSARAAIRAAIDLQARLDEERQADGSLPLFAGIGMDVGEPVPLRGGYRGGALNLAARLCSLAQPGEIFVTQTLAQIAPHIDGVEYRERGDVSVKGLPDPVRVLQLAPAGTLPDNLPPLQAGSVEHPNNLPFDPTPFIGRRQEVDSVVDLLRRPQVRLVTLTGPGGTGKTRLACRVGQTLLDDNPDGVYVIQLETVSEPASVMPAIAQTLGVSEEGGTPVGAALGAHLSGKRMLLTLDNFEHVRPAAVQVAGLLADAPNVKMLVTSRVILNQYGEYSYEVPPMDTPDPARVPNLTELARNESIALFCERAQAVKASFALTKENARDVAEICARLDGLPLAIELAAARIRILPPRALLARLESRLNLLTGGSGDRPARQQTLRGAIDWSYSLLSSAEQTLFARLSVFAGGCSIEAVEAVCNADGDLQIDVLDGLTTLVESSLIRQDGEDEPRFRMLETIREYALWALQESVELRSIQDAHLAFFTVLAEEAEPALIGPHQAEWFTRLDAEQANVRAAMERTIEQRRPQDGLRLAAALWRYWWGRGHLTEGRRWLDSLLEMEAVDPALRARALNGAANLAWSQGALDRAEELHRQALALRRELGDTRGIALSLNNLGVVTEQRGDFEAAAGWYEQALDVAGQTDDQWTRALLLGNLGGVLVNQGDHVRGGQLGRQSLEIYRALGDRVSEARVINNLMYVALEVGDHLRAAELQRESLQICVESGNQENMAYCMQGAGNIMASLDRPADAARLWGAADALRHALGQEIPPATRADSERFLARAREQLDEGDIGAAWTEGELMPLDQALSYALKVLKLN